MAHAERNELFAWLAAQGYRPVDAERLQALLAR
jgi:hypothetical protein